MNEVVLAASQGATALPGRTRGAGLDGGEDDPEEKMPIVLPMPSALETTFWIDPPGIPWKLRER